MLLFKTLSLIMGGFKLHFIKEKKKEKHSSNCIYIKIHNSMHSVGGGVVINNESSYNLLVGSVK